MVTVELFSLDSVFYEPVVVNLPGPGEKEQNRLCVVTEHSPNLITRLAEQGWVTDVAGDPNEMEQTYDVILSPVFFHTVAKEEARRHALRMVEHLEVGGLLAALFPPAWFPREWESKTSHHHIEKNERMIIRSGNRVFTFTIFTNREIYSIFKELKPVQMTTLQNGFRRALFKRAGL